MNLRRMLLAPSFVLVVVAACNASDKEVTSRKPEPVENHRASEKAADASKAGRSPASKEWTRPPRAPRPERLNQAARGESPQAARGENPQAARGEKVAVVTDGVRTTPSAPREPPASSSAEQFVWNVWAESTAARTFKPVPFLKPGDSYRFVVDLSGLPYERPGVSATTASPVFKKEVEEWIGLGATDVDLQVVMLHDPQRFERPGKAVQRLKVDVTRMQSNPPGSFHVSDPFEAIRVAVAQGNKPAFVYGRAEFTVTARTEIGLAALGFSVWADGRPVQEFHAEFCIAGTNETARSRCAGQGPILHSLRGLDSVRLAVERAGTPDGALHFVQMTKSGNRHGQIMGVFWRKGADDEGFVTWRLDSTPAELGEYIAKTVMPQFFSSTDPAALRDAGRDLYNTLFPSQEAWADASAARRIFEDFMKAHPPLGDATLTTLVPSIFVRTVLPSLPAELIIPVGFMNVNGAFVGFSMRAELALPVQSYRPGAACVSRWVMALPPQGSGIALDDALRVVESRISGTDGWISTTQTYRDIASVRGWLLTRQTDTDPSAFFITSHHNQQSLFFKAGDAISPREIERTFAPSSIAVLNGCGTGEAGAIEIINQLSQRNVGAVIATATAVKGEMAGWYLACLADAVGQTKEGGVGLGQTHFVAVHCLSGRKGGNDAVTYGARALAYLLIGNGNLRLCPPRKAA